MAVIKEDKIMKTAGKENLILDGTKLKGSESNRKKLLVHLHLFYHDQLDWFVSRLKNITCDYDLWITVTEKNREIIKKIEEFKLDAHILKVPNRGYDIYPFWLVLQNVCLSDYDFVLKIHTKNSRTTRWVKNDIYYNGFEWRNDLINPLLGSKRNFKKALAALEKEDVGMVGSNNLIGDKESSSQSNNTMVLCAKMGIKYTNVCRFVCGTMFMVKSNLLQVFQKYPFNKSDFSVMSQTGSTGTIAHSLETVFGLIVQDANLKLVGVDSVGTRLKAKRSRLRQRYIKVLKTVKSRKDDLSYIKHSKYFCGRWYLRAYPDVAKERMNPARHYLLHGWREGRKPGPKFDPSFYLDNNLDVKKACVNPLLHYEKYGKYEGRVIQLKHELTPISLKEIYDARVGILKSKNKSKVKSKAQFPKKVIVSLTTYPARIKIVQETIKTLKEQSVKPNKIILYLSEKEFPKKNKELPKSLMKLCDKRFEIHWIKKTLYSFQKLIPALKEYPNLVIVTADDDILYENNWLELLLNAYSENPNVIHCHRAHRIRYQGGKIKSYNLWKMSIRDESTLYNNFLTGVGGVLYPPNCLDKNITNSKEFLALCPKADDIWIWAMALKKHTKIHVIKNNIPAVKVIPGSQEQGGLFKVNTGKECYNDVQLRNVLKKYPEILTMLKRERRKNFLLAYLFFPYYLISFLKNKNNILEQTLE